MTKTNLGWKGFYVSLQLQVLQEGILPPPCRDPPATQVASLVVWNLKEDSTTSFLIYPSLL